MEVKKQPQIEDILESLSHIRMDCEYYMNFDCYREITFENEIEKICRKNEINDMTKLIEFLKSKSTLHDDGYFPKYYHNLYRGVCYSLMEYEQKAGKIPDDSILNDLLIRQKGKSINDAKPFTILLNRYKFVSAKISLEKIIENDNETIEPVSGEIFKHEDRIAYLMNVHIWVDNQDLRNKLAIPETTFKLLNPYYSYSAINGGYTFFFSHEFPQIPKKLDNKQKHDRGYIYELPKKISQSFFRPYRCTKEEDKYAHQGYVEFYKENPPYNFGIDPKDKVHIDDLEEQFSLALKPIISQAYVNFEAVMEIKRREDFIGWLRRK